MRLSRACLTAAAVILAVTSPPVAAEGGERLLLTEKLDRVNAAAAELAKDPQIVAAREELVRRWSALPPAQLPDGRSTLHGAVEELVFNSVRSAVEAKQFAPTLIWGSPPYTFQGKALRGSRWGIDDPDRIYRSLTLDPALRYVLHGQRGARPSNEDFLFEVTGAGVKTLLALPAKELAVAPDGSFRITLDDEPAAGRRNHLTLPAEATGLLIRDTLSDWNAQLPNRLSIEVVGGTPAKPASLADTRTAALASIAEIAGFDTQMIDQIWKGPENQIVPKVRSRELGLEGAILGISRFRIADDEALVLTIDKQGAGYVGLQLTDPWARSLPYWNDTSSLSDRQVKPNADGTATYIVSPRDPGYYNWLSTVGTHEGIIALRVENFAQVDPAKVVRSVRLVKLSQLAAGLPAGAAKVAAAERAEQLAQRKAGFEARLAH